MAYKDNTVRLQKLREYGLKYRVKIKSAVINVLTNGEGTCRCCGQGDIDVLGIDHIHNNGNQHRASLGPGFGGDKFYRWLVHNDYPTGYQVLCMNCNTKKEIVRKRGSQDA